MTAMKKGVERVLEKHTCNGYTNQHEFCQQSPEQKSKFFVPMSMFLQHLVNNLDIFPLFLYTLNRRIIKLTQGQGKLFFVELCY